MDYAVAMEMVVTLLRSMIKKLHLEATLAVKKQKHLMLHHLLQLHKPLLLLHLQLLTPILFQRFLPAQRKHSLPPPQRLRSKHSLPPRQRLRSKHSLPPPQGLRSKRSLPPPQTKEILFPPTVTTNS